jgi:arylsulfatase A-like enzyme
MRTVAMLVLSFAGRLAAIPDEPAASAESSPKHAKPNIVVVLADDLGYGDLGCYGQRRIRTPHLDALAARGVRFTQAYCGGNVCAPSRCALMTGMHTGHSQVRGNTLVKPEGQQPLAAGTPTLARALKSAGYATGAFGKWALGGPGSTGEPSRQGFDEFFGYLCQNLAHEYYPAMLRRHAEAVPLDGRTWSHDRIEAEALDFIRRHEDGPFFCYAAFTLPHGKLQIPELGDYARQPWPRELQTFAAMVTRLDAGVGRIVALLRALRIEDNTLVLFLSDNGAEPYYFRQAGGAALAQQWERTFCSSGPLRGYKRDLYEGGIRTPVILSWPGRIKAGAVSEQVWAFWDLFPTLAEIADAKCPAGLDGVSVAPAWLAGKVVAHAPLYWEFHEGGFSQAVRWDAWKAVRLGSSQPVELYDLAADLAESNDVAAKHPDLVARAEELFRAARTDSLDWPIRQTKTRAPGSTRSIPAKTKP